MRPYRIRWLVVVCVAGLTSSGVSEADPRSSDLVATEVHCGGVAPARQVDIVDYGFEPEHTDLPEGGVVRWTNDGDRVHTVTSGDPGDPDAGQLFDSGDLAPGESYCLQLSGTGTARYFCRPHPTTMRDATIEVGGR